MRLLNEEVTEIGKKILQFLEENYPKDFSIQEISDNLKIHRNTVSIHLRILKALKLVKLSRKLGTSKLYTVER